MNISSGIRANLTSYTGIFLERLVFSRETVRAERTKIEIESSVNVTFTVFAYLSRFRISDTAVHICADIVLIFAISVQSNTIGLIICNSYFSFVLQRNARRSRRARILQEKGALDRGNEGGNIDDTSCNAADMPELLVAYIHEPSCAAAVMSGDVGPTLPCQRWSRVSN